MNQSRNKISFGGGVQSTAMFLMACLGILKPKPDFAVFADTGWEKEATYKIVEFCKEFGKKYNIPLFVVKYGDIHKDMLVKSGRIPFFINKGTKENKKKGMFLRSCTERYKINMVRKFSKIQYNASFKNPYKCWIGISLDEIQRMKPSNVKYQINTYPLVEQKITRDDCKKWLYENFYGIPVQSACIGCPYQSDESWKKLTPEEFESACKLEESLSLDKLGVKNATNEDRNVYLHSSLIPLRERPFESGSNKTSLFDEECSGGCFL